MHAVRIRILWNHLLWVWLHSVGGAELRDVSQILLREPT